MRIAINTRLLIPNKMDGIGWFTAETARRMVTAHPEHQFFFFFDRKPSPEFLFADNVTPVVLCPQARHPVLWYMFFEWSTRRALKKHKIELYLSPDGMMPLHPKVPTLTVIHDLNFEHADGNIKPSHQRYTISHALQPMLPVSLRCRNTPKRTSPRPTTFRWRKSTWSTTVPTATTGRTATRKRLPSAHDTPKESLILYL